MGSVTPPLHGEVYVDADTIIYRVERVVPYDQVAAPLWDALDHGSQAVVISELSVLEVLVKPLKVNDGLLVDLFRRVLYDTLGLTVQPISRAVLELAAQLRAVHGLKTPDAIHAATALNCSCVEFITNDAVFKRVPGLPVIVLNEVAVAP